MGSFNVVEFIMRVNIVGVGRFTISLYGEIKRGTQANKAEKNALFIRREKLVVEDYIDGLRTLSALYDDESLLNFVKDFQMSSVYSEAFNKSVQLAKKRNVAENKMLKAKTDIDSYFRGVDSK